MSVPILWLTACVSLGWEGWRRWGFATSEFLHRLHGCLGKSAQPSWTMAALSDETRSSWPHYHIPPWGKLPRKQMSPHENDNVSPVQIEPVLCFLPSYSLSISRENGVLAPSATWTFTSDISTEKNKMGKDLEVSQFLKTFVLAWNSLHNSATWGLWASPCGGRPSSHLPRRQWASSPASASQANIENVVTYLKLSMYYYFMLILRGGLTLWWGRCGTSWI